MNNLKIFILTPNAGALITKERETRLNESGNLTLVKDVKPFTDISELYEGSEPRILAIDPDFCELKIPNEVLDKIPNLKCVCLQTTSFSWIDIDYAKKKGIPVTNLRGWSTVSVAEWATMIVLALARKLPVLIQDGWKSDLEKHKGIELRGKTAGIIGLGRIGTALAENMAGLGMNVQYWSKNSKDERFKYVSLEELLSSSDVILPAVAHNDETEHLVSDSMLSGVKPSAILVNITHPVYNHQNALQMMKAGKLYGYGFEETEGKAFGSYGTNIWNGPALAWCTDQSLTNNAEHWIDSIISATKGKYPTQVNT